MHRCQHSFKKNHSNLWVVHVGSNSFLEISYAGKPQAVSRYSLSNLWDWIITFYFTTLVEKHKHWNRKTVLSKLAGVNAV